MREVVATNPEAYAAIWSYLLGLDLTRKLVYELAPADDPLQHMLTEGRTATYKWVGDAMWLRLVDLPRALRERAYAEPFEIVFEVTDDFCPWNTGRWALRWDGESATCAKTALPGGARAQRERARRRLPRRHDVRDAGPRRPVRELRGGALAAASRAFRADVEPWCPEIF